jgi:hypothetical protein
MIFTEFPRSFKIELLLQRVKQKELSSSAGIASLKIAFIRQQSGRPDGMTVYARVTDLTVSSKKQATPGRRIQFRLGGSRFFNQGDAAEQRTIASRSPSAPVT